MRKARFMAAVAILAAIPAAASVILPLTVEDMAGMSKLVVIGEVNQVTSELDPSGERLYTRVMITPEETLKGEAQGATVEIKFPGGRTGDLVARLPGAPEFRAGERVLVFLEPREDGDGFLTLAMYLGKFEVMTDPQTGRELAVRRPQPRGVALAGDDSLVRRDDVISLDEVREIVRRAGGVK